MERYFVPVIGILLMFSNLFALENHSQSWGEVTYAMNKWQDFNCR